MILVILNYCSQGLSWCCIWFCNNAGGTALRDLVIPRLLLGGLGESYFPRRNVFAFLLSSLENKSFPDFALLPPLGAEMVWPQQSQLQTNTSLTLKIIYFQGI